jgi:hypothetical protein
MRKPLAAALVALVLIPAGWLAGSLFMPGLLLFPYERRVGQTPVYSETPIPDDIEAVIGRADTLLKTSEIFQPQTLTRPVFLTRGGWRWRVLAIGVSGAFGETRSIGGSLVINRSDIARDKVWNGSPVAGERRLSDVIAHERTHILIRARFGLFADQRYPAWVREGYCDHVAGSSSLTDEAAARLRAEHRTIPALVYYDARKRVEDVLHSSPGNSVEALFRASLAR